MRKILLLLITFLPNLLYAQYVAHIGSPFIENHTKSNYRASNQNWSISQSNSGIIYVANNDGLLTYNGVQWALHPNQKKGPLRSVSVSNEDSLIYVGGREEFGYYKEDEKGKISYTSLAHLVQPDILKNDDIWKIFFLNDAVLFQSFSKLYIYKNNEIEVRYGEGEPFLFMHKNKRDIFIEKIPSGLQRWHNGQFEPLAEKISNVLAILPIENNKLLLATAKEGLFIMQENGNITPWLINPDIHQLLKDAQINNGLKIDDQTIALGTIKNGIFLIDTHGKLIQHIHKRNGLQNNTVLSLFLDKQNNIWAGLDYGIDRIEINSAFYYYKDVFGELGSVYAIKKFKNHIYVGTNQGLFYSVWPDIDQKYSFDFHFVQASQGQVWSLNIFNDKLICGHNEGTFLVDQQKFDKISDQTGAWLNYQPVSNSSVFIQGNYTGLTLFTADPNWQFKLKYNIPNEAIIDMKPIDDHKLWVVLNRELEQYKFSKDYQTIKKTLNYNFQHDLPKVERMGLANIKGNTILSTDKGLFIYDNVMKSFTPYDKLNKLLGRFSESSRIIHLNEEMYMLSRNGELALLNFYNNAPTIDSLRFNRLKNQTIEGYESVEKYKDFYLFGLDQGFAIYDSNFSEKLQIGSPLITAILDISSQADTSVRHISTNDKLSFKQNNLRIEFALPWYDSSPIRYQYKLEGYSDIWSTMTERTSIDYTALPSGKYTFYLKAITASGQESAIEKLSFEIQRPWYFSWYALAAYLIVIVFFYILLEKNNKEKLKNKEKLIRKTLEKEQEEILKKEAEENEKKLMEIENQQLQKELSQKNRELSNVTTHIVYKNELLNNLHHELKGLKDRNGAKLSEEQLSKVNKLMDNAKSDQRDWDIFEKSFNESHGDFFKKLKADFPALSPNDLKLCAYLRLNMTSKDIASLLHISTRGVEVRRYRLRKKFDIPTDKNLTEFLLER
ncbi:triple tyrosine motif-containing protein [Sphingobacterium sp. UT-1RO-CII-1]|uniref:triple tyrosine motif-containing protein n=1 Tax=Sphingobacterium sp. UT-1RO-CII-1 TaxID=2995225 RepID=UPI00227D4145|nr:triple tyrosine motif-containing protein [Sphingobacterium sp. UT-1RO-CII-1]MCY4778968.1 triple tyrosine motif-containing protein [Sphingobacterium sp. UT-1RO-CII-1]